MLYSFIYTNLIFLYNYWIFFVIQEWAFLVMMFADIESAAKFYDADEAFTCLLFVLARAISSARN